MASWEDEIEKLYDSGEFDADWYARHYGDVPNGIDPAEHFLRIGARLGRRSIREFDRTGSDAYFKPEAEIYNRYPQCDVIVPVYNAIGFAIECVRSFLRSGDLTGKLIVIDDGSEEDTQPLADLSELYPLKIKFIRNSQNLGYTTTINRGIAKVESDYFILINSDCIAPRGLIGRLLSVFQAYPDCAAVGPLSNAASWQSVPKVLDNHGRMIVNDLPSSVSVDFYDGLVRAVSNRVRPTVPILNGFCTAFNRAAVERIGGFDEDAFPTGYGEENDLCLRLAAAGYTLRIADDAYVYHAKSKSFGDSRREELSKAGSQALRAKHGDGAVNSALKSLKNIEAIDGIRERLAGCEMQLSSGNKFTVLWLLPVRGGGGGAHSIMQEVSALTRVGIKCRVAVKAADLEYFSSIYADLNLPPETIFGFWSEYLEPLINVARTVDVIVSSVYHSTDIALAIQSALPDQKFAYYVQDYEPMFFEPNSNEYEKAKSSYNKVSGQVLFAKTEWIISQVKSAHGLNVEKVIASIDHDVYFLDEESAQVRERRSADGRIVIGAMIRPETPRRGAQKILDLCERLGRRLESQIEFHFFGSEKITEAVKRVEATGSRVSAYGKLTRHEVASVLRASDVFIDLSDYQAFGRTALEAMACGCACIIPINGGGGEYAVDGLNALMVDPYSPDEVFRQASALCENPRTLKALQMIGPAVASQFSGEAAAASELKIFIDKACAGRPQSPTLVKRREVAILHSGSRGSPAGSGFVRTILPYTLAGVRNEFDVVVDPDRLPEHGSIVVLQRTLQAGSEAEFKARLEAIRARACRLVFEIDDDLLHADGLIARGESGAAARETVDRVSRICEAADEIAVSTDRLGQIVEPFNKSVTVLPNRIDLRIFGERYLPRKRVSGAPIVIGYVGTPTHTKDLASVADAFREAERQFSGRLRFEVIGAYQRSDPLFGGRIGLPSNSVYPRFVHWLRTVTANWTCAIAPLAADDFNRSKSALKWMENGALSMATLCSRGFEYDKVVDSGRTGLLVDPESGAWLEALTFVVENTEAVENMGRRAFEAVVEQHTLQAHVADYRRVLLGG